MNIDPRDLFISLNPLGLDNGELEMDSTGFADQRTHGDYIVFLDGYKADTVDGEQREFQSHRPINAKGCKPDSNILLPPTVTQAEPWEWRNMATAPKDETLVFLYVYLTGHPTADADYETTVAASGFDHTEFDNRQFASMDREQDRSTEGLVTPIGWLPITTIERGEAYHSFRNSGRRA